jgi:hypothetical protein
MFKKIRFYWMSSGLERYVANKYAYFFFSILILLAVSPHLGKATLVIMSVIFLAVMITLLWALKLERRVFRRCFVMAIAAFTLNALTTSGAVPDSQPAFFWFDICSTVLYVLFLMTVVKILLWKIFTEREVTADTVQGGISIYFLMGLLWAFVYDLVLLVDPSAISIVQGSTDLSELVYFSYTTLTTLGYGDIVPLSGAARSLTTLEAMLGQVFLTVFVARLVGLYLRRSTA